MQSLPPRAWKEMNRLARRKRVPGILVPNRTKGVREYGTSSRQATPRSRFLTGTRPWDNPHPWYNGVQAALGGQSISGALSCLGRQEIFVFSSC